MCSVLFDAKERSLGGGHLTNAKQLHCNSLQSDGSLGGLSHPGDSRTFSCPYRLGEVLARDLRSIRSIRAFRSLRKLIAVLVGQSRISTANATHGPLVQRAKLTSRPANTRDLPLRLGLLISSHTKGLRQIPRICRLNPRSVSACGSGIPRCPRTEAASLLKPEALKGLRPFFFAFP